jgi:hypothetical protein
MCNIFHLFLVLGFWTLYLCIMGSQHAQLVVNCNFEQKAVAFQLLSFRNSRIRANKITTMVHYGGRERAIERKTALIIVSFFLFWWMQLTKRMKYLISGVIVDLHSK